MKSQTGLILLNVLDASSVEPYKSLILTVVLEISSVKAFKKSPNV